MEQQKQLDRLQLGQSKQIKKELDKDEKIILSSKVYKFNHNGKKQSRILGVTNKNVLNLTNENFARNLFSLSRVKRKIPLNKIGAITVARHSTEFVIHIPTEYDYRFNAEDFREQILLEICRAFVSSQGRKLGFFYKDDLMLTPYTTTKFDKKRLKKMPDGLPQLLGPEDMKDNENAKGQSELIFTKNQNLKRLTINEFDLIKVLGRGAFGKVMLCKKKDDQELYAIKSIRKEDIIEKEQIEHTKTERKLLEEVDFPFLVSLEFAFQTKEKLFFVMKFLRGGELFYHLKNEKKFKQPRTIFYAAQILLAIEYLHKMDVIYRDLKPENILLDADGYVKITDYGLAKKLNGTNLTHSFAGTPEYLAPEIINCTGHHKPADWWSLGILIFEMLVGIPPFYHPQHNIMFERIQKKEVLFPQDNSVSPEAQDLILKLLQKDVKKRLVDSEQIKSHPFFKSLDFKALMNKQIQPEFVPKLTSEQDVNNFDQEFTNEEPINSVVPGNNKWVNKYDKEFQGMTFIQEKIKEEDD